MKSFLLIVLFICLAFWPVLPSFSVVAPDDISLEGHTKPITSLSFSADGKRLASGSMDGSVRIWDAKTGSQLLTMEGHHAGVGRVLFSENGRGVVSADVTGTIKVWSTKTGAEIWNYTPSHSPPIQDFTPCVALSHDGRLLAAGFSNGLLFIYDFKRAGLFELVNQDNRAVQRPVTAVAFSPDGSILVGSFVIQENEKTNTTRIVFWNKGSSEPFKILKTKGAVKYLEFLSNGIHLVSGMKNGRIRVFELQNYKTLGLFEHGEQTPSVSISTNGSNITTTGGNTIKTWNLPRNEVNTITQKQTHAFGTAAVSRDGAFLAFANDNDSTVKIIPLETMVGVTSQIPEFVEQEDLSDPATLEKQIAFWKSQLTRVSGEISSLEKKVEKGFQPIAREDVEGQMDTDEIDWNDAENIAKKKAQGEDAVKWDAWSKKKTETSKSPRASISVERPSPALMFSLEQHRTWKEDIEKKIKALEFQLTKIKGAEMNQKTDQTMKETENKKDE